MIHRHDFNSEWWGTDVGIVADPAFFQQPTSIQVAALQKYAWVEFAQPVSKPPLRTALAQTGFFHVDTQIRFRLDMRKVELSQCARQLEVKSATELPFEIEPTSFRPFLHERFQVLPGATEFRVCERYSLWASRLISLSPATCLRFNLNDEIQGWFLAQPGDEGLQLTLAMLSTRAIISGYDLYARAIAHLAKLRHRLGFASFSVSNLNVLNIYSRLGAHFLEPRECWIWVPGERH
jgi:hypothetical protein